MAKKTLSIRVEAPKPRNPLVAAAITRGGAGAHAKPPKAERRRAKAELAKSLRAGDAGSFLSRPSRERLSFA